MEFGEESARIGAGSEGKHEGVSEEQGVQNGIMIQLFDGFHNLLQVGYIHATSPTHRLTWPS